MFFTANERSFVLSCGSQLHVYDLDTIEKRVIDLPKPAVNLETKKDVAINSPVTIICGRFSSSGTHFALCDDNKRLLVWSIDAKTNEWQICNQFKISRKSVKLVFTRDEKQILVGDRSGDVYTFDLNCAEDGNEGFLLMGHLSMLLDMSLTPNEKYLITCDRDEKIRISCYPNAYNIHAFCLGHSEFVSSICFLTDDVLLSGSGDATIRTWFYCSGEEIFVHDCSDNIKTSNRIAVKEILRLRSNLVLVLFYKLGSVAILKVDDSFKLSFVKLVDVSSNAVTSVAMLNNSLIFSTLSTESAFVCYDVIEDSIIPSSNNSLINLLKEDDKFVKQCLTEGERGKNSVDGLYKTWYNNVDAYLERKKERQEMKRLKKMCKI